MLRLAAGGAGGPDGRTGGRGEKRVIELSVPDFGSLALEHLVLDFNGTLAEDGALLPGVREALGALSQRLQLHVVTGDTFGRARQELAGIACELVILDAAGQAEAKARIVERLGPRRTACIGNGRNDRLMLGSAALGVAVLQKEGASAECLAAADVVCRTIVEALDLLVEPLRLTATLRG